MGNKAGLDMDVQTKRVVVLGSTGSIGKQALEVIEAAPERYHLAGIAAGKNAQLALQQAARFHPRIIAMGEQAAYKALKDALPQVAVWQGQEAICQLASLPEVDVVVMGISGVAALPPLLHALGAGKTVALANKESIVCGNPLVKAALAQPGAGRILPVDSEQSAIFQCLQNGAKKEVKSILLTASGGPFRDCSLKELQNVTPEKALKHPTWNMGRKITIDSATLFNKGLEVMEAAYLFDLKKEHIQVLVHPQSIVHSMVEYQDGTVMAQMAAPDMRLAIQYALTYPARVPGPCKRLSLLDAGPLTFLPLPAHLRQAVDLAYEALERGGTLPTVYNGANEAAVGLFLERKLDFLGIHKAVERAMAQAPTGDICSLADVKQADAWAKAYVAKLVS